MNLNIIGNNFGASLAGQTLKVNQTKYFAMVNGEVTVQPGNPAYERAEVMELTVEGLLINTSGPTSVYATMIDGGIKYITIAKAWVKDEYTICIEKVGGWSSQDWYKLTFQCIFFPLGLDFRPQKDYQFRVSIANPSANFVLIDNQCLISDDWMYLALTFDKFKADQADTPLELDLRGTPNYVQCDFFLVYNDPLLAPLGSGVIDTQFVNGNLVLEDGMPQLAIDATGRKFLKGVIVLN